MSIATDLSLHTDHPTTSPPAAPVPYQYYRGGSLQRKGLPDDTDGVYDYLDSAHAHAVTGYRGNTYDYDARACPERRPKVA